MTDLFNDAIAEAMTELEPVEVEAETTEEPEMESEVEEAEAEEAEVEDEPDVEDVVEEESEEAEEEEPETATPIELAEDDVVIVEGTELKVREALLRQADYTKKTQQLAEDRKALEAEREQFQSQGQYLSELEQAWTEAPEEVIAGFAGAAEDPIEVLGDSFVAMARADDTFDANLAVVKTIVSLIQHDLIEDDLRELLGFDDEVVGKLKAEAKTNSRIARLERQSRQAPEAPADEGAQLEAARRVVAQQWDSLVSSNADIAEMESEAQANLRRDVARKALERGGIPLDVAYDLLLAEKARTEQKAASKRKAVAKKKAANRVVSKPTNAPTGSSGPKSIADAITESMNELGL